MERTSVWIGRNTLPRFPSLDRRIAVDVAIVGGGITGMTAAMLLRRQGKKVALLEAREIGGGTTGNSTGNLYATVSNGLFSIRDKWGSETMQIVADSRSAAVKFVEQTVRECKIDCAFARCDWLLYTTPDAKQKNEMIDKEFDALRQARLSPQYVEQPPLPFAVERAITLTNQAQFDPLAYTLGLARQSLADGCQIFQHTPVTEVDPKAGLITTAAGSVTCEQVVLATHTPKGVYTVHAEMHPALELGLACRLADGQYPEGIVWGMGASMHSLRSFAADGQKYLVVIGDKCPTGKDEDLRRNAEALEAFARSHFRVASVDYQWAAQHFRSADDLPFIGTSRRHDNVYIATGFSTDGLTYGTLAAMLIADSINGRENPWLTTYDATRMDPIKAGKGFLTENLEVAKHLAKDYLTDKSVVQLQSIKLGDGGLVDTANGKRAVYRDPHGNITALSPVCTHLKCIVHWNSVQKTWDCPCHGSRFCTDGTVLEGPALHPLQRVSIE
jgi:glycine/D-amino acid oxidase-like deaminating enzyme/nitrite reductase/ring-hydroxylating ferredoxin subunit